MRINYIGLFISILCYTFLILSAVSCEREMNWADFPLLLENPKHLNVQLKIKKENYLSKVIEPDENKIKDINLFVFNGEGLLEQQIYLEEDGIIEQEGKLICELKLLESVFYQIKVGVNLGYRIQGIRDLNDLNNFRYHLAYPDEYLGGCPMSGSFEGEVPAHQRGKAILEIELERIIAKVSVSIDRTRLDKDVKMWVRSIALRQCPRSAYLFQESDARNEMDVFPQGYYKEIDQADGLNIDRYPGISEEVDLYMLENCQGNLLPEAFSSQEKLLDDHPRAKVASYIEMEMVYESEHYSTDSEKGLLYRFYLGEGPKNFSIERNAHYHYVVRPEGDGLAETSWRVDKSRLNPTKDSPLQIKPAEYIEAHVGEEIHVWAEMEDEHARFDLGWEELEYERERGMFRYQVDDDGKGVRLQLLQAGTAILYMSSGSFSAMAVILIKL